MSLSLALTTPLSYSLSITLVDGRVASVVKAQSSSEFLFSLPVGVLWLNVTVSNTFGGQAAVSLSATVVAGLVQ